MGAESADIVESRCLEGCAGWSDSGIVRALDTSTSMVRWVRQQLVEEGLESV